MTTNEGLGARLIGTALARGLTPADVSANRGAPLRRYAAVRNIDEQARTVEVAFSSEAPVERWFGTEILSHEAGACDLSRLLDGGAVLVDHDRRDHVGRIETARIDDDRRGRAVLRFGRGARAEEIWQDVVDGIRHQVSVAYFVEDIEVRQAKGEPDTVTLTRWQPYEISIVAVPADPSVGVGRAANPPEEPAQGAGQSAPDPMPARTRAPQEPKPMKTKITRDAKGNLVRAKVDEDGNILEVLEVLEQAGDAERGAAERGASDEAERTAGIMALAREYDAMDLAADFVGDRTRGVGDFQTELLRHVANRRPDGGEAQASTQTQRTPAQPAQRAAPAAGGARLAENEGTGIIGMSGSEADRYSFVRALRALAEPHNRAAQHAAAFEMEASAAAAAQSSRDVSGLMVPVDVLTRALNTSTSGTNPGDTGGFIVDTTLMASSFIDILRNRAVMLRRARTMGGLVGNIAIPKKTSASSGYWLTAEDAPAQETGMEIGQIGMTLKTAAAYTELTRNMLTQSSLGIEAMVRDDIATALGQTVDRGAIYGTGTNGAPLGIMNTTGVGVVEFAGTHPTFPELVAMETAIATDNADVDSMAYVFGAATRGALKTTPKMEGGDGPAWEAGGTVNGYGTEVTNQMAAGDVLLGNFADLIIGMWGGLELTIDPYTHSTRGRLRIVAFQDVDVVARRVESFSIGRKAAA